MKNQFRFTCSSTFPTVMLLLLAMVSIGATKDQPVGPKPVGTTTPVAFAFGNDAVVKLKMEGGGQCDFKVTRVNKAQGDFQNLCDEDWYAQSEAVKEPHPDGTDGQYSIYQIEKVGVCPDENFPFHIDIINYGVVQEENKVLKLRLIHK